jgi:hypothetical protein
VADRLLAVEDGQIVSYPGGWADYVRAQEGEVAPPPPKPKREKPARPAKTGPSPLEAVEAEVALAEERVNELERRLAADWGDVDLLAAHRQAREELARLITRWESLFEASGSTTQ